MTTTKDEEQALMYLLPGLVYDRKEIIYSEKVASTSEDVESIYLCDPIHYTGEETAHSYVVFLTCCKMIS